MSSSIRKGFLIVGAITILTAFSALPQNQELQEKLAIARESARENKMKLMQYQWTETNQITLKGDQKPPRQYLCQYGPDGQVPKPPPSVLPRRSRADAG